MGTNIVKNNSKNKNYKNKNKMSTKFTNILTEHYADAVKWEFHRVKIYS